MILTLLRTSEGWLWAALRDCGKILDFDKLSISFSEGQQFYVIFYGFPNSGQDEDS